MKRKMIGDKIKWYHPFKLQKRNEELDKLTIEQFKIITEYCDQLKERDKTIENLEEIIKSLKADLDSIVAVKELIPEKKTRKRKSPVKKEVKPAPKKRGRKKKEEK